MQPSCASNEALARRSLERRRQEDLEGRALEERIRDTLEGERRKRESLLPGGIPEAPLRIINRTHDGS